MYLLLIFLGKNHNSNVIDPKKYTQFVIMLLITSNL